jgi:hypothetical protein
MLKKQNGFILFSSAVLLFILVIENINGRFWLNDFRVYYGAANSFLHGGLVYGEVFGEDTGLYKYSPELLVLFVPAALLPFKVAAVLHYLLSALSLLLGLRLALRLAEENFNLHFSSSAWILTAGFFVVLNHVFRELHLGNVNLILVLLLLLAYRLQSQSSWTSAAFLFAICILFKPYFVILAIPFLVCAKWVLIWRTTIWLMVSVILFSCLVGIFDSYHMHAEWLSAMMNHSVFLESWNTIAAMIRIFTGCNGPGFLIGGISLTICIALFFAFTKKSTLSSDQKELLLYLMVLALIPNILITDTEHFLFSFPLIMTALAFIWKNSRKGLWLLIPAFIMYGAISPEWFGSYLADELEHHGVLGLGNLLILFTTLFLAKSFSAKRVEAKVL